jgi:7-keto-8-aminopelargonate synthetase-like enzyme
LTAADDADEQQWAIATPIVDRAAAEISGLARAGASRLTRGDLERLTALEADLARVEQELGR